MPGLVRCKARALRAVCRRGAIAALLVCAAGAAFAERARPVVASMNLCADQLVLALADPAQIATVSWLSADAEESLLASAAAEHALNYGSAEELLRYKPDVVIAGAYTNAFTRALLARLGYAVVELEPEESVADIEANVLRVAAAVERPERGAALVAEIRAAAARIAAGRPAEPARAVVVRPGAFTVGANTLADELMRLAGARNVAAEQGLDRWGSLSMETLLRSDPELIVLTSYRTREHSLANAVLEHPALARLRAQRRTADVPAAYWSCGLPQSLESAALLQRALRE